MTPTWPKSLKTRIILQLLIVQIVLMFLFGLGFVAYLVAQDEGGILVSPKYVETAAKSIRRGPDGHLKLIPTTAFRTLQSTTPDLWFIARSDRGEILRYGPVPDTYLPLSTHLDQVGFADIRDLSPPYTHLAVIRRVEGPAGPLTVLGKGHLFSTTFVVVFLSNLLMIPLLGLMAILTMISVPLIVTRAFNSLSRIANQAEAINIDQRGHRLTDTAIPTEITPLVQAINGALGRLDEGYERHQRFILDAAHELRTPIAILQTRVEALDNGPVKAQLLADAQRIGILAEHLLDLQRLQGDGLILSQIDLIALSRDAVADMAPLVIARGGQLSLDVLADKVLITADRHALVRVLINLIQNALEHGRSSGQISVRVTKEAVIEVEDDGPGIPIPDREKVLEPFHRLRPHHVGTGLGLHLVQRILELHGARLTIGTGQLGGALFRLHFPLAQGA